MFDRVYKQLREGLEKIEDELDEKPFPPWNIKKGSATEIGSCPNLPEDSIMDMQDNAKEIDRDEFLEYVNIDNLEEIEKSLGYDDDFTMDNDWHVAYYKSYFEKIPCIYFVHSHIEYVFLGNK